MRYNVVKNANEIISNSNILVKNPEKYIGKWSEVFNNSNPIMLELGMGRGSMIINMAMKYPNLNFIGLELDKNQIATALNNAKNYKLNNLKMIHANASDLANIFKKDINTIYLTFSEPWPKKQDERKRFTHESYLRIYDRVFKKDKHIILKTDNKILFSSSLESLSKYWYSFNKVSLDLHNDERKIESIMTDWEKKCLQDKKEIYYLDATFSG